MIINGTVQPATLREALLHVVEVQKVSRNELAQQLGIGADLLGSILLGIEWETAEPWFANRDRVLAVLRRYGLLENAAEAVDAPPGPVSALLAPAPECDTAEEADPFMGSAEEVSANETQEKAELFAWADAVLGLSEAELALEIVEAAKRFGCAPGTLKRVVKARRNDKRKERDRAQRPPEPEEAEHGIRYYGSDFKVSNWGVFARRIDKDGCASWERISTTRIDILALTRDTREENWGAFVTITNRDGGTKSIAIPHALTAADKTAEIAALLASLGVGVVPSNWARQQLVQFLTQEVKDRITSVPHIGWHRSGETWVFVLPDDTVVPAGCGCGHRSRRRTRMDGGA